MSVFNNLYTRSYEKYVKEQEAESTATSFTFFDLYFTSLISTFKWEGITQDIPFFEIERFFQSSGTVGMNDKHEIYPIFPSGGLLENGEYSKYTMLYANGKTVQYNRDDIVIGYNNSSKMPYIYMVNFFSERTSKALEAVNCALDRAMLPVVVDCQDETELKQWLELKTSKQYEKFMVALRGKMTNKETSVQHPFDNTKTDIIALWDVYVRYRNLYYTTIGINNVEIQKRERLTEAEGAGNDEITRYTLLTDMFDCRKDFTDRCNKKFGTDLKVYLNRDTTTVFQMSLDNEEKIEQAEIEISKGSNIQKNIDDKENNDIERDDNNESLSV